MLILVAIGWMYVVLMAAVAEATAPGGTTIGAVFTVLLWGVLPLSIVLYILGTPARRRAAKAREADSGDAPGHREHAADRPVASEREEA